MTGYSTAFVLGSAKNDGKHPASFFLKNGERVQMHFCTVNKKEESSAFEHCWNILELNFDFFQLLKEFGRLPIESMSDQMKLLNEHKK